MASDSTRNSGNGFSFFFSSRRRHTRSYGDWSSDVCSSDLGPAVSDEAVEFEVVDPALRGVGLLHELRRPRRVEFDSADGAWRLTFPRPAGADQIGRASCRERGQLSVAVGGLPTETLGHKRR